jgi:hypothetical protein
MRTVAKLVTATGHNMQILMIGIIQSIRNVKFSEILS